METGAGPVDAIGQIVAYLLSFGLPGVCLIVLGYAYKRKDERVEELQDTLIKMAGENATAMVGASNAINGNTAVVNSLRDLIVSTRKAE